MHLSPTTVRTEAVGRNCREQLPEASKGLKGFWDAEISIKHTSVNEMNGEVCDERRQVLYR